jgi:hypothetical protein
MDKGDIEGDDPVRSAPRNRFGDLRRSNERRARTAAVLEARRERRAQIERVVQVRRERRFSRGGGS